MREKGLNEEQCNDRRQWKMETEDAVDRCKPKIYRYIKVCFSTQRNGKKTKTVLKEMYLKTKELGARKNEPGQWMIYAV
jgi:hypothetical protein